MPRSFLISRREFLAGTTLTAAGVALSPFHAFAQQPPGPRDALLPIATVSPMPAQTMQGFGAAGAWWPEQAMTLVRNANPPLTFAPWSRPRG